MKTCQTLHYNKTSATFLFPNNHDALYHYKLKQSNTLVCQFFFYYVNPLNLHSIPHMFEIEIINVQFSIAHLSWPRRNTIHLISKFFFILFSKIKDPSNGNVTINLFDVSSRIKHRCFTGRVVCTCISLQGA